MRAFRLGGGFVLPPAHAACGAVYLSMSGFSISGPVRREPDALSALPLDAVFVVPGDEIFVDHEGGFLK